MVSKSADEVEKGNRQFRAKWQTEQYDQQMQKYTEQQHDNIRGHFQDSNERLQIVNLDQSFE